MSDDDVADGIRPMGAGVLVVADGRLILGKRSALEHDPGTWACFGGMAEPGEGFRACAVREVFEEAGIALDPIALVPVFDFREGNGFRFVTFLARVEGRVDVVTSAETDEADGFRLGTTVDDLWDGMPAPLHPGMAALVRDAAASSAVLASLAGAAAPRVGDPLPGRGA